MDLAAGWPCQNTNPIQQWLSINCGPSKKGVRVRGSVVCTCLPEWGAPHTYSSSPSSWRVSFGGLSKGAAVPIHSFRANVFLSVIRFACFFCGQMNGIGVFVIDNDFQDGNLLTDNENGLSAGYPHAIKMA